MKPTIVLVHGAFADASGWLPVITLLQEDGYPVLAVQIPLLSLADDVATAKRAIDAQAGPVVAVGHSYGGAVITEAAAGNANVTALVYLSAFLPEPGEPLAAFLGQYPVDLDSATVQDAAGFVSIDPARYQEVFAADLPARDAAAMAVAQKPIAGSAFGQSVQAAAWQTVPAWCLIARQDRALNPDLERFYAKRADADTTEIDSSHVSFLSHPREVADLIGRAAAGTRG